MEFLFILLFSAFASATKFNTVMVRLPLFDDFTVSYDLEVKDGGCYEWHSSRDDVAVVTPVYGSRDMEDEPCSSKAAVSATPHRMSRGVTDISATDVNSGEVFLIEVEVARIAHLEFSFPSPGRRAELFLGGSRRHYRVSAKDEFGTSFTSLDGVQFEWELRGYGPQPAEVKIVRAADSYYTVSQAITELESIGLTGNTILLEGIEAGTAQLVVRLPHPEYSHVNTIERKIAVLQELLLRPSVVLVAPEDILVYSIEQLHSGKFRTVTLDRSLYELHIENDTIIEFRPDLGINTVISKAIGRTRVLLREIPSEGYESLDPLDSHITATSDVTVSPAVSLSVRVIPHNVLVIGSEFTVRIGLRDRNKRELNIGPKTEVTSSLNPMASLNVWSVSDNGTIVNGKTSNISIVNIKAELLRLAGTTPKSKIRGDGTLTIISLLKLVPESIVISLVSGIKPSSHRLMIQGGVPYDDSKSPPRLAADYVNLFSSNDTVAAVMTDGVLTPNKLGSTRITAKLKEYKHIEAFAKVTVVKPSTLRIARVVTLPSGYKYSATHALHVALWSNHPDTDVPLHITTCDSTKMQLMTLEGMEFVKIERESDIEPINQACTVILAKASGSGTALVEVSLKDLSDSARLWVHEPLKLEWPPTDNIAIGVGASLNLILTGGPLASSASYDIIGHSTKKNTVHIKKQQVVPYAFPNARVYNIICRKSGNASIQFAAAPLSKNDKEYYNSRNTENLAYVSPGDSYLNDNNEAFDLGVKVHCFEDIDTISIATPRLRDECPEQRQWVYILSGGGDVNIALNFSTNGLLLYNISGIDLEWSITHPIVSFIDDEVAKVKLDRKYDPVPIPESLYQILTLKSSSRSSTYTTEVNLQGHLVKAVFNVTVIKELFFDRQKIRILPELNQDILAAMVYGGSGYREIARVIGKAPRKEEISQIVSARLSHTGALILKTLTRTAATLRIDLRDLCLPGCGISLIVYLESVAAVYTSTPFAMAVNSSTRVSVWAVSGRDRSVLPVYLIPPISFIDVSSAPRDLAVREVAFTENEIIFELYGSRPGVHSLRWRCGGSASKAIRVRVFPGLRLWPRAVTLPPKATLRVATLTRPPPEVAHLTFTAKPEGIVEVLQSGVVNVLSSTTSAVTVTGVAKGRNGQFVLKDSISIKIIPIQGIFIEAPTLNIEVGATIPLWISGLPSDMDRTQLCTLQQSLSFLWNIEDYDSRDVFLRHPVTGADLVGVSTSEGCVGRFRSLNPGKYNVTLNVLAPGSLPWLASTEISVRPSRWTEPVILQKGMDMKIHSVSQSHTYQKVHYSILDSNRAMSVNDIGVVSDTNSARPAGVVVAQTSIDESYYPIEFSSVKHIMISVKENNVELAVGDSLKMKLSLHDALGRTILNARRGPLKVTSSRPDIARTRLSDDRSILTIDILSDGAAVILVDSRDPDSNTLMQDHIRIHSSPQIWLPIGSVLCGSWESERPQDKTVLRHLGIGLSQVVEHLNAGVWLTEPKTKRRIYINTTPVSKVSILATSLVTTDGSGFTVEIYNQDLIVVPILLSGVGRNVVPQLGNTMCKGNNLSLFEGFLTNRMVHPFSCILEYKQDYSKYKPVIEAVPYFDFETGKFACRVRLQSELPSARKVLGKLIIKPDNKPEAAAEVYATLLFTQKHLENENCSPSLLMSVFSHIPYIVLIGLLIGLIAVLANRGFARSAPTATEIGKSTAKPVTSTPDHSFSDSFTSPKKGMRSLINSSSMSSDADTSRPIYGGAVHRPSNRFPHTFLSPN